MTGRGSQRRRFVALLLGAALVLTGCSWDQEAPGLLGRASSEPTAAPLPEPSPTIERTPEPGNPELPVVGEALWRSAEGRNVTVRLAVHAIRRIPGATVLDWSVTPLSAGDREVGDAVPPSVNLGLGRLSEGTTNIFLVARGTIYRPLIRRASSTQTCLCTPLPRVESHLRIGRTTLAQLVFPELPDGLGTADVFFATVPPVSHVPVTPIGMVPTVSNPTDLTRSDPREPSIATTPPFRYEPARQRMIIAVDRVYASSTFTSLAWRIRTLDPGSGLDAAVTPPITDADPPAIAYNIGSAGGPRLRALSGRQPTLPARLITTKTSPRGGLECLCSDLRLWANSTRRADTEAMVVTNFAALPPGTTTVDVEIPGLATLTGVEVTASPDAAFRSAGPVSYEPAEWDGSAPDDWSVQDWPTAVPSPRLIAEFRSVTDDLVR